MKRSEMIQKIAEAIEKEIASRLNDYNIYNRCATVALKACEDAGMLAPIFYGPSHVGKGLQTADICAKQEWEPEDEPRTETT